MRILVTSAESVFSKKIISILDNKHNIVGTDISGNSRENFIPCLLDDSQDTDLMLKSIDVIINVGFSGQLGNDKYLLDYYTRRIYNLLLSASKLGISKVINISTLRLYENLYENLAITENWNTIPSSTDIELLCSNLCEIIHKEFARDNKLNVTNIRLGYGDSDATSFLSDQDLEYAINQIIYISQTKRWENIHIQSNVDNQRFITKKYESLIQEIEENK